MTQESNREPEMSALDFLLKGKPTEFQRDLLQLARRKHWDEDDPGFAVPLVLCQIENLLAVYPDRIKAAMEEISRDSEMKWDRIQAALKVSAMKGVQAADQIDGRLAQVRSLLDLEISQVERLMQTERQALQKAMAEERAAVQKMMADERAAMGARSQELVDQQKQVLKTQTKALIAEGVVQSRKQAETQVKTIVQGARKKHYTEAVAYACAFAAALMLTSWTTAWVSRGRAENSSTWGDLERWNQEELQACQAVDETTCNIHIVVPK